MKTNNLKVIILIGLPASGKTTWALNYIAKNENFIRTNRDELRLMLKNQNLCENKIEELITNIQDSIIINSLNKKQNVIVDNTNLKKHRIEHIIDLVKYKADIEFIYLETSLKKCLENDIKRGNKVGSENIIKMKKNLDILLDSFDFKYIKKQQDKRYLEIIKHDNNLENCVIVDFDNTLSFMSERSPYDWESCINDYPNNVIIEHINLYKKEGYKIIIVTGRDEVCRTECTMWLEHYKVDFDFLFMRKKGDYRKDNIIKEEIYDNEIKNKFNVFVVLDDRKQVVDMWRSLGLNVFQVNESPD
jgi:predicted kinase